MKEYYIWLLTVMGAANPRSLRLISHFGGIKQTYQALSSGEFSQENAGFLKPYEIMSLKKADINKSRELVDWCGKHGYGIVTFDNPDYPEPLKHIYNPPILLFTQGDISGINSEIRINVIGTRTPCDYSCKVAAAICGGLAATGIVIVSGMAVGLDKSAMTAALDNGGIVAGVLACGIDVEYPRWSGTFRKAIAESGGVCISELMPRDSTRPAYFQERNRIMSGLASGTLIIEAGERSGCHITALHTLSQNRDLFCIPPHDILDPRYSGVVRYLRDGAIPVFSHVDIINEYLSDVCKRLSDSDFSEFSAPPNSLEKQGGKIQTKKSTQKSTKNNDKNSESLTFKVKTPAVQTAPKADYTQLPENQAVIITALQKKKLTFDEIVKKKLCDADKAYEILLDMELDGLIEKIAGDRYQITQ